MTTMTPERWQQIEDILDEVMPLAAEVRAAHLDRLCSGDPTLRGQVEEMIGFCEQVQDKAFLEEPPHLAAQDFIASILTEGQDMDLTAGTVVGPYTVIRPLGRGGMGEVLLAERADPRMRVALKVVKRGMDTNEILQRFRYEREILARLNHPHIAQLYGGDVTEDGRPYFAMEYVEGDPLDAYCDANNLSIRARLALFKTVCEAVRYAHRHLVVHRDLKPGNILVSEDEAGQPLVKLLDFGIAKVLDEDAAFYTVPMTGVGERRMTPGYAAPEQVRGRPTTPATDVYALGVILYQLLTGRRPYYFDDRSITGIESVICQATPDRPSTVVVRAPRSNGIAEVTPEGVSRQRAASPRLLRRQLSGDLDAITMMALRKEPDRRYASATEFLDDIQRYLDNRPVQAQPDAFGYRVSKFVRRHAVWVTAASVAVLALLMGLIIAASQARRANQEARRANAEVKRANEMLDFVVGMFDVVDPQEAQGRAIAAQDLIETGLLKIEDLNGQPLAQATMMDVMGRVLFNLGEHPRADSLYRAALALRVRELGEDHAVVAENLYSLAVVLQYRTLFDEAVRLHRQALAIQRRVRGEGQPPLVRHLRGLAYALYARGAPADKEEAIRLYRQALDIGRGALGETHPDVLGSLNGLALVLHDVGRLDEAEGLYRRVLEIRRETLRPTDPRLGDTMYSLARFLQARGEHQDAESLHRQALAIYRQVHGEEHFKVATSLYYLARILVEEEQYAEAESYFRQAADLYRKTRPADDLWQVKPLIHLGSMLLDRGAVRRAEEPLRQALEIAGASSKADPDEVLTTKGLLGRTLTHLGRYEEAEALLMASYLGLKDRPAHEASAQRAVSYLITLYEQWQKPDEAATYRALQQHNAAAPASEPGR